MSTGRWPTTIKEGFPVGTLDLETDRDGNLWVNAGNLGILDGATRKLEIHRTAILNSRPRRGSVDDQNRLWFAEYDGNAIGMLEPLD